MNHCKTFQELKTFAQKLPTFEDLSINGNNLLPTYEKDMLAFSLWPKDSPITKDDCFPVKTVGDGQCFPRTLSRLVFGNESQSVQMRIRLILESIQNKDKYLTTAFLKRGYQMPYPSGTSLVNVYKLYGQDNLQQYNGEEYYDNEIMSLRDKYSHCGIWQLHAAANILKRPIYSIFPGIDSNVRKDHHRLILPSEDHLQNNEPIFIMWTKSGETSDINHFVPVVR